MVTPGPTPAPGAAIPAKFFAPLFCAGLLLAVLLRFAGLENHPPGLFRDEAEKGYGAWSLARTGAVIEFASPAGIRLHHWPWMIDVLGNPTSALYHYAAAPWVGLGGLSVANARRPAALFGTLAVLLATVLAVRAWGPAAGLFALGWLAYAPWLIVFSRWAQQASSVPLLLTLAFYGCLGIERERRWGWPVLGAALGWLFYAYSGAQPFVLAWTPLILIAYARRLRWRRDALPLAAGALFAALPLVPTLFVLLGPGGATRLAQVAVWHDAAGPVQAALALLRNYILHFSPAFLFLTGDPNPRHAFPGQGMLLPIDALLVPLGMAWLWCGRAPLRWPLLLAVVCGPLPAAITRESPHALRSFPMALPLALLAGLGAWRAWLWLKARCASRAMSARRARLYSAALLLLLIALGSSSFARYWRAAAHRPDFAAAFQVSMRQAWETLRRERRPGERIFMSSVFVYAPWFQLFYLPLDPVTVARGGLEQAGNVYYFPEPLNPAALPWRPGDWMIRPRTDPASAEPRAELIRPQDVRR